jgi:hypothetical protein
MRRGCRATPFSGSSAPARRTATLASEHSPSGNILCGGELYEGKRYQDASPPTGAVVVAILRVSSRDDRRMSERRMPRPLATHPAAQTRSGSRRAETYAAGSVSASGNSATRRGCCAPPFVRSCGRRRSSRYPPARR